MRKRNIMQMSGRRKVPPLEPLTRLWINVLIDASFNTWNIEQREPRCDRVSSKGRDSLVGPLFFVIAMDLRPLAGDFPEML